MEQRTNCPHCTDTRQRFYQRDAPEGTYQFCHNCGYKKFIPSKERTPSQVVDILRRYVSGDTQTNVVRDIKLPSDFTSVIPVQAKLWLKKYDITDEEIEMFGIGWSERYSRLILPVYSKDGKLLYYQGRTFKPITKDNPKYMNIRQSGVRNIFFTRERGDDKLCVVEDILSAIKVGRYVSSLALLGSYFPKEIYPLYRSSNYIWLDSDKYTTAIKHARDANQITGKSFKIVHTKLDPKECRDTIIKESLA